MIFVVIYKILFLILFFNLYLLYVYFVLVLEKLYFIFFELEVVILILKFLFNDIFCKFDIFFEVKIFCLLVVLVGKENIIFFINKFNIKIIIKI